MYLDKLSGAVRTQNLVEILFLSHFQTFFVNFKRFLVISHLNLRKKNLKSILTSFRVCAAGRNTQHQGNLFVEDRMVKVKIFQNIWSHSWLTTAIAISLSTAYGVCPISLCIYILRVWVNKTLIFGFKLILNLWNLVQSLANLSIFFIRNNHFENHLYLK